MESQTDQSLSESRERVTLFQTNNVHSSMKQKKYKKNKIKRYMNKIEDAKKKSQEVKKQKYILKIRNLLERCTFEVLESIIDEKLIKLIGNELKLKFDDNEINVLEIIMMIIQCINSMKKIQFYQFLAIFFKNKIIKKIEDLINVLSKRNEKQNLVSTRSKSHFVICIYSYIQRGQVCNNFNQYPSFSLVELLKEIEYINNQIQQQNRILNNKKENKQLFKMSQETLIAICSLSIIDRYLSYSMNQHQWFKQIINLIHLNCNCKMKIIVEDKETANSIKNQIYFILNNIINTQQLFSLEKQQNEMLTKEIKDNKLIQHINSSLEMILRQRNEKMKCSNILTKNLIISSNSIISKQLIQITDDVKIIQLSSNLIRVYQRYLDEKNEKIPILCLQAFYNMNNYGSEQFQGNLLFEQNYIQLLITSMSSERNKHQSRKIIQQVMKCLWKIFIVLKQNQYINQSHSNIYLKCVYELTECEGGYEENESYLFHKKRKFEIVQNAKDYKSVLNNCFVME